MTENEKKLTDHDHDKYITTPNFISLRKNSITASNRSITPKLSYYVTKTGVEFNGSYLKEDKPTFNY